MAYTLNDAQIGEITEVTGAAKIIRTDGSEETVTLGTEIFQGDIVETADAGAVNITFIDESSFAVSNDARIQMDEFVFDPATESGSQDFSVMQGVFMYTSGLIGRENPDSVEIDTPVGSIGIRGTIIGGNINPNGVSQVSVIEGAIVVRNNGGEQLLTNQFDTVQLSSLDIAPSEVQTLDVTRVANDYGAVKDVSVNLFSSFNDQMQEEGVSRGLDSNAEEMPVEENLMKEEDETNNTTGDQSSLSADEPVMDQAFDARPKLTLEQMQKLAAMNLTERDVTLTEDGTMLDNAKISNLFGPRDEIGLMSIGPVDNFTAQVGTALEDVFDRGPTNSRLDDVDGVIPIGEAGAVITRLTITDPDPNEVFGVGDIILGNSFFDQFFEIANENGNIVLKLEDNISIENVFGNDYVFQLNTDQGNQTISSRFNSEEDINIGNIILNDSNNLSTTSIRLAIGMVENVTSSTSTSRYDIASTEEFSLFGTENNDYINVTATQNFQLIRGGNGTDRIYLDGTNGADFDFSSNASNITGDSRDLSSIEHIFFNVGDTTSQLTIDIDNIMNLLRTSDLTILSDRVAANHNVTSHRDFVIHTNNSGEDINGFRLEDATGASITLEQSGFTDLGTDARGTYEVFYHAGINATVSIESNIQGADTGGIII
jgi:hypothetical protein